MKVTEPPNTANKPVYLTAFKAIKKKKKKKLKFTHYRPFVRGTTHGRYIPLTKDK